MRAEFAIACARLLTFDPGVARSAAWVTEQGAPVAIDDVGPHEVLLESAATGLAHPAAELGLIKELADLLGTAKRGTAKTAMHPKGANCADWRLWRPWQHPPGHCHTRLSAQTCAALTFPFVPPRLAGRTAPTRHRIFVRGIIGYVVDPFSSAHLGSSNGIILCFRRLTTKISGPPHRNVSGSKHAGTHSPRRAHRRLASGNRPRTRRTSTRRGPAGGRWRSAAVVPAQGQRTSSKGQRTGFKGQRKDSSHLCAAPA
jgi:hypothetical protein